MLTIDILFEDISPDKVLEDLTNKALLESSTYVKLTHNPEVSVVFTNDAFIQELNKQYRHQDKPTNVLSFPLPGDPFKNEALGDIIISIKTIQKEAEQQGKTFEDHLQHMLVHGFLHLLGYDHEEAHEAEAMENLEVEILKDLGISNPYKEV